MQFPRNEAEILTLSMEMLSGLDANAEVYPAPPVETVALGTLISAYTTARNAVVAAQAAADEAYTAKQEALEALVDGMKTDIRYCENTVDYDDDKLKLIGWGGRKARTPLAPPGQSRLLEAPRQGEGWVFLDWKAPTDGGKPSAYKVMRRQRPDGPWQEIATALETEAALIDQPRGVELEYRVIAANKSGDGEPSNTVLVVL